MTTIEKQYLTRGIQRKSKQAEQVERALQMLEEQARQDFFHKSEKTVAELVKKLLHEKDNAKTISEAIEIGHLVDNLRAVSTSVYAVTWMQGVPDRHFFRN
jgi:N-glycosylase/DNA lyase